MFQNETTIGYTRLADVEVHLGYISASKTENTRRDFYMIIKQLSSAVSSGPESALVDNDSIHP